MENKGRAAENIYRRHAFYRRCRATRSDRSVGFTAEEMAERSMIRLREKILVTLPDDAEVYPAHGAGKLCSKNAIEGNLVYARQTKERQLRFSDNEQRKNSSKSSPADQPEAPAYFAASAGKSERLGIARNLPKAEEFSTEEIENFDGVILDVRNTDEYGAGHIPNAITSDSADNLQRGREPLIQSERRSQSPPTQGTNR